MMDALDRVEKIVLIPRFFHIAEIKIESRGGHERIRAQMAKPAERRVYSR